jgi:ATP citrate (pro-S)-lyase
VGPIIKAIIDHLLGESLGVPIEVYGPETRITNVAPLALGIKTTSDTLKSVPATPPASLLPHLKTTAASTIVERLDSGAGVGATHPGGERTP